MAIGIGIIGYGNVGKGVEAALPFYTDMELTGIFTRRDPGDIRPLTPAPVYALDQLDSLEKKPDVLILCTGSATDLPRMTPALAEKYCVVDSFDTHANIPGHFAAVNEAALRGHTAALISAGWDPGLFSMARLLGRCVLPQSRCETFWGRGVSQGHSDAIRRIPGVKDARQYTVPVRAALEAAKKGEAGDLTPRQKHTRECYVVLEEGADPEAVAQAIITMPHYFDEYDTSVTFITEEEMLARHGAMPHAGEVLRHGITGVDGKQTAFVGFEVAMDSNPQFTGSILLAFARGVYRFYREGRTGCFTAFDMPLSALSPMSREELLSTML